MVKDCIEACVKILSPNILPEIQKIPLSRNTVANESDMIAKDIIKQIKI